MKPDSKYTYHALTGLLILIVRVSFTSLSVCPSGCQSLCCQSVGLNVRLLGISPRQLSVGVIHTFSTLNILNSVIVV